MHSLAELVLAQIPKWRDDYPTIENLIGQFLKEDAVTPDSYALCGLCLLSILFYG